MSTRRTRSSSRATSVRGETPDVADITITPARRRSKSAANTGRALPAVNAKHSTAYGTNTTSAPGSLINTKETKVGNVFQTILEADEAREEEIEAAGGSNHPELPQRRPSRRGNSVLSSKGGSIPPPDKTPPPPPSSTGDKSFVNESGVFREVEVESSSVSAPSPEPAPFPTIYEEDEEEEEDFYIPVDQEDPVDRESIERELEELERQRQREIEEKKRARERAKVTSSKPRVASKLGSDIPSASQLWQSLPSISFRTFLTPLLILGILYLAYSLTPDDIGYSIGGYVGKYIPSNGRGSFFADKHVKELKDLRNRFKSLESQIATIEKQPHLTPDSIKYLESNIPDFVVVRKDRRGNLQIPTDFWKALHSKISGDTQLFPPNHEKDKSSKKDTTSRDWERFLDSNKVKVKGWVQDEIDKEFNKKKFQERLETAFNGDAIISRSEMIRLLKLQWADTTLDVKRELKELRNTIAPFTQYDKRITGVEKTVQSLESRFKALQLQALSQAHLNGKVNWGLRRVNHFSPATGAHIDIRHTSPNYVAPINNHNILVKTYFHLRNNPLPVPKGPEEALKDWDAYGDCWCSPAGNDNGWGASLGVYTGNAIYPDQVIIEHVPRPASLAPGAAPRDMELLAFIDDPEIYRAATEISTAIFPDDKSSPHGLLPPGYVRLAKWTFDGEFPNPVQAFDVQIRLGEVDKWTGVGLDKNVYREAATTRLIVRALNNWGVNGVPEYTCLYRVRVHGDIAGEHSPFDGKI
ncbi:hypothetical protein F5884DRAFT_858367 [Xylogone sp. PMI_703]|nr:hypothetical protein F5884DRAFT_858367 [Xylogone sp. PMI_703]